MFNINLQSLAKEAIDKSGFNNKNKEFVMQVVNAILYSDKDNDLVQKIIDIDSVTHILENISKSISKEMAYSVNKINPKWIDKPHTMYEVEVEFESENHLVLGNTVLIPNDFIKKENDHKLAFEKWTGIDGKHIIQINKDEQYTAWWSEWPENSSLESLLCIAVKDDDYRAVDTLLEKEADPDSLFDGLTALEHSVYADPAIMSKLLKSGADITKTDDQGLTIVEFIQSEMDKNENNDLMLNRLNIPMSMIGNQAAQMQIDLNDDKPKRSRLKM